MAVLAATGLTIGHDITVDALVKAVGAGVTLARQAALCAGCAWYDLGVCARGLAAGCVAAGWEEEARDATARSGAGREHSDGK